MTELITAEEIRRAESARDVAQHAVAAAMARVERSTAPGVDVEAVSEYATAIARRDLAQARIAALEAEREAQLAELAQREAAELAAAALIDETERELDGSRTRVLAAIAAAENALLLMHTEAERHATLVSDYSAALLAAGLTTGELTGEPLTYADPRGSLRVRGQYWHAAGNLAAVLLGRVAYGVAQHVLPHDHGVRSIMANAARLRGTEGRTLAELISSEPAQAAPAATSRRKAGAAR